MLEEDKKNGTINLENINKFKSFNIQISEMVKNKIKEIG